MIWCWRGAYLASVLIATITHEWAEESPNGTLMRTVHLPSTALEWTRSSWCTMSPVYLEPMLLDRDYCMPYCRPLPMLVWPQQNNAKRLPLNNTRSYTDPPDDNVANR